MIGGKILIIDDEENLRNLMGRVIALEGYQVVQASTIKEGLKLLTKESVSVVITDVKLPDGNGIQLTSKIKQEHPAIEVIVLTAYGTIQDGVLAIKSGAFDYLTKGDHQERILPLLSKAYEKATLQQKIQSLENRLQEKFGFDSIIGNSKQIMNSVEIAKKVSGTDATVLLLGETGVGKEVFAQAIHYESTRKAKALVTLNCSAFPRDLLESELFGHAEGAFTGASKQKKGLIEEAHGGTLFLDELGEMGLELQAKLLRVLENGEFYRVGDPHLRKVDVRIVAATNRQLEKEVEAGHFRKDLFYRLSVFTVQIPALRERQEDIEKLATFFIHHFALKTNKAVPTMTSGFLEALKSHPWKGNIRELKNVIERCIILNESSQLDADLLPLDFNTDEVSASLDLSSVEKTHIKRVLTHTQGNKTQTAKLLGIGLTTLYQKIKDYNL
jgi:two-component system NtrC family response regulator